MTNEEYYQLKLQQYPKYKDSGVEWLGEIPEGWEVRKLRHVAKSVKTGTTPPSENLEYYDEGNIDWYTPGDFAENLELGHSSKKITDFAIKKRVARIFEKETILLVGIGATLGKIALLNKKASTNQQINAIVLNEHFIPKFYAYYLSAIKDIIISFSNAATLGIINQERTKQITCIVLPKDEQLLIATFLDQKTAKIDELIKKNETLIEILKEKRQAIISQVVTKGLDLNAKMHVPVPEQGKDSGIEWIGEIPEGWDVKKLRFLSLGNFQYGANEEALDDNPDNPRYIRITDIKGNGSLNENTFKSLSMDKARHYLLKKGDILFARSGATVGKTFQYKESWGPCCYAGYLIKMSPDPLKIESDFVYYFTQSYSYKSWRDSIFIQATIQNISAEKYKNFQICFPDIAEQRDIINFLNDKTNKICNLIKKIQSQIEKLKEYRQTLISNVVTGKVKVK